MLRATALRLAGVGEGEGSMPAAVRIWTEVETGEEMAVTTGTDRAGTAVAPLTCGLPPSVPLAGQTAEDASPNPEEETVPVTAEPDGAPQAATAAQMPAARQNSLPQAAQALLDAWDKFADGDHDLVNAMSGPVAGLRAALIPRHVNW